MIRQYEMRLAAAGSGNAKRSVEELAAHVLGCKPLEIYFRKITPEQEAELEKLIVRAEQSEPIQYIIGHVDFRGLEIRCDRRALIPRPETELLVDAVLSSIGNRQSSMIIADIGTGTGCIALALLSELPNAEVLGIDLSPAALALARENAKRLGLIDRFSSLENNLLEGVEVNSLDIAVSNPPYILSDVCKTLDPSVRDFEPQLALDGGRDGLDLIRILVEQAARVLKPGGGLFLEIGYDQGPAVRRILQKAGFEQTEVKKDLAGHDRIVLGRMPGGPVPAAII
ncbi:MAG TPA: peptide chain release factor N(5)-glutamine methyltransferase [Pontiellaceae bacterium]|nr:peptide chain release factor N(5)-glutamine methyltransferase [Pontiellaceae bacterium]HPR82603.1 peptide chain release factor N(5)-glutamine methyltransferase [Pontiellaceae bacterium]